MGNSKQNALKRDREAEYSFVSGDAAVEAELKRILDSDSFKSSVRCQDFLKHVVQVVCSEAPESLKERTIGVAVFGRSPDYDTGEDAIVRVKANEVRRRLSQYNQNADPQRSVVIELNPGSYAPRITRRAVEPEQQAVSPKPRVGKLAIGAVAASLLLVLPLVIYYVSSTTPPLKKFWRPFLGHDKPIICISHPGAYHLTAHELARRNDASAAVDLNNKLQALGRSGRIAIASDVSASDLAVSPIITIGGPRFNRWTLELSQPLRFAFQIINDRPSIVDRDNPKRFWSTQQAAITNTPEDPDYVIITRLVPTGSRKEVLCIAGLTEEGTRVGTKLVFDQKFLESILKFAPEDWDKKNLQFVVHTSSVKGINDPELVAAAYW
jgi:hypothetical protein